MNRITRTKDGSLIYDSGKGGSSNGKDDLILLIDTTISKKMSPIYWIIGIALGAMVTIFLAIALPIQNKLMDVALVQQTKMGTETAEKTFLKKEDYYLIEEDANRVLKGAIKTPQQADYLIDVINDNIMKQLGFKFTTRGGATK